MLPSDAKARKNPKRAQAGSRNRALRGPLTDEGRQRLREAALQNRPWEHATGPRSVDGKKRSAANGKVRQVDAHSVREVRVQLAEVRQLINLMRDTRRSV